MAEIVLLLAIKKIGIALANEVTNQASAQFAKHAVQLTELQGNMGRIMTELRVMHDFLCQMDIGSRGNQVYQGWKQEVRKVVCVMEDMVDEYLHLVGSQRDLGCCFYLKRSFRQPRSVLSLDCIASRVNQTEKNLAHLSQTKERWVPITNIGGTSNSSHSIVVQRPQDLASISRSLSEEDLVGIEDNKQKLVDWLGDGDTRCSVIVVHGMGGLGKTSLASVIYRKEQEKFDSRAWVSVSQTYTREDILRRLIIEIFKDKPISPAKIATMDITDLQDTVKSSLEQRKYLIVLDDVWTHQVYTDLSGVLVRNLMGSRIIITTRNANIGHLTIPERALELKRLSKDDSWELFRKAFLNHECPEELKDLSEQILSKCDGLPLAIVSIARLLSMRSKTRVEWKRIDDQLSWELINNTEMGHVRNVLHLSYMYLPTSLKSCFLYCSLFPEDYLLQRNKLIRLWIAEGFVESRGRSTTEEVAEGYIKELIHMNMLQLVNRNSFGRIKSFRMHDIVRELAVDLCQRDCFGIAYNDEDIHGESIEGRAGRRMVIHKLSKDINPAIISSLHWLRSMIALDKSTPSSSRILSMIMDNSRYMSVLELSGLPIHKVPDAIGDLFNLRHLGLRDSKVELLPNSIEKLSNLLTLDLYGSEIQELPSGIVKLKKLRHLFAQKLNDPHMRAFRWCSAVRIPEGLKELRELQTLQAMELHDDGSVRCLKGLAQMRSLRITGVTRRYCEGLWQSLHQMKFLSSVDIIASSEDEFLQLNGLSPLPPNLEKLELHGRLAQADMLLGATATPGGQNNLCIVTLFWSQLEDDPLPSLSLWSSLTEIDLTRAYVGEQLAFRQGWFPSLKTLRLRYMPNLKQLEIHQGAMTSLQKLVLMNLSSMVEVPRGIEYVVPTLKLLAFWEITPAFLGELRNCPRLGDIRWQYTLISDTRTNDEWTQHCGQLQLAFSVVSP